MGKKCECVFKNVKLCCEVILVIIIQSPLLADRRPRAKKVLIGYLQAIFEGDVKPNPWK